MKYWFTLLFISTLFFASSCKKSDNAVIPDSGLDSLETNGYKFNYASLQMDGKSYVWKDDASSYGSGNRLVNRKIESIEAYGVKLDKGDPDSTLFSREYTLINDSSLVLKLIFSKKLAKKDCLQELWFFYPKDQLELFRPGLQNFATDFDRENSYDGVGIELTQREGDKIVTYSTYSLQFESFPTSITNDSQDGSYFDITKLATIPRGEYIEATFKAKVFNLEEEVKSIDKGFLRLRIGSFDKQEDHSAVFQNRD